MISWKQWHDLRARFWIAAALLGLAALAKVVFFAYAPVFLHEMPGEAGARLAASLRDHIEYVDTQWFGTTLIQVLPILAIVFSLGGVLTQSSGLVLNLSFPVPRRRWVWVHFLGTGAILLTLALASTTIVVLGGWLLGEPYSAERAIFYSVFVAFASLAWAGATLAAASWTRDLFIALLLMLSTIIALAFLVQFKPLSPWSPWGPGDPAAWQSGMPWRGLLTCAVLALGGLFSAIRKIEQCNV